MGLVVVAAQSCSSVVFKLARMSRPRTTACKFPDHMNYALAQVSAVGFEPRTFRTRIQTTATAPPISPGITISIFLAADCITTVAGRQPQYTTDVAFEINITSHRVASRRNAVSASFAYCVNTNETVVRCHWECSPLVSNISFQCEGGSSGGSDAYIADAANVDKL